MEILEIVLAGLAAGVLSGMFGVGGGILFVPALVLIADLTQVEAIATSLAAMIPVVAVGTWRQRRYGNVDGRAALVIGLTSAAGVAAGTAIAESVPEGTLQKLFAVLLFLTAGRLVWTALRSGQPPAGTEKPAPPS
jgi:uncharacterized membrane protein YfcA